MSLPVPHVLNNRVTVRGIDVFYRESGDPAHHTIVLLHGFPSSSHMFRDLIPKLAAKYHVIAADMPGFGYSDQAPPSQFQYTFDNLATFMDEVLGELGLKRYSIYVQDYGAPVGFRLFTRHPDRIQAIISQNGNAYVEGLSSFWEESIAPYWREKNQQTEAGVRNLLTIETTRYQYSAGFRDTRRVSPDAWTMDQMTLDRPGNAEIQLALFYDYQNNIAQYTAWHDAMRRYQPALLAFWGRNDPIFLPAGAEAFLKDLPRAEIRFVDSGHFALEDHAEEIGSAILDFLQANLR